MGLDMYLKGEKYYWTNWRNPECNLLEDGFKVREQILELGYWRKHPNLHGFIVNTFNNGKDDCEKIELSVDDLKKIIDAIKNKSLPHTEGFFFGRSDLSEEEEKIDIEIIEKAILWIETEEEAVSRSIYYEASW